MKRAQVTYTDNSIEEGETKEERGREYTMVAGGGVGGPTRVAGAKSGNTCNSN